jgi:hypothetical protein
MNAIGRVVLTCAALAALASPAAAQFGMGGINGISLSVSADTPLGAFDNQVNTGFGIMLHTGMHNDGSTWGGRSNFGFDRFGGKDPLDNVQIISFGFDLVHYETSSWYEFLGLGLYNTRFNYSAAATGLSGGASSRDQNFGLDGGVGVLFGTGQTKLNLEFGIHTMFTSDNQLNWVPVRVGIKF